MAKDGTMIDGIFKPSINGSLGSGYYGITYKGLTFFFHCVLLKNGFLIFFFYRWESAGQFLPRDNMTVAMKFSSFGRINNSRKEFECYTYLDAIDNSNVSDRIDWNILFSALFCVVKIQGVMFANFAISCYLHFSSYQTMSLFIFFLKKIISQCYQFIFHESLLFNITNFNRSRHTELQRSIIMVDGLIIQWWQWHFSIPHSRKQLKLVESKNWMFWLHFENS